MKTVQLHHFTLTLPDEHWLPPIRRDLPDYAENVGRLAAAIEQKYPGRGVIDIGANIGDTAAIVRAHASMPILCIEGLDYYFEILKHNVVQLGLDVELEHTFVDAEESVKTGSFTIERGTGFFRPNPGEGKVVSFQKLDSILARHPRFRDSKLLKVDTDGMDGRILMGALEWLAAAVPVVFWEHDLGMDRAVGGPGLSLFDRLLDAGYRQAVIFDNKGEYIETLPLTARQQLSDVFDYLPGGDDLKGYCDVCAFHETDLDLCESVRRIELEARRDRRKAARSQ